MDIAVIGSGHVGSTLGRAWEATGHTVIFGGRTDAFEAAERADVVVFAVPGREMADLVGPMAEALTGKVVIDATNRLDTKPPSAVQLISTLAPGTRVARAFNSVGW